MIQAASRVATDHRQLVADIAGHGQAAIIDRARNSGISHDTLTEMIRALPPQLMQQTYLRWFQALGDPVLRRAAAKDAMLRRSVRLVDFQDITTAPPSLLLAMQPNDDLLIDVEDESNLLDDTDSLLDEDDSDLLATESTEDDLLINEPADEALLTDDPLAEDPLAEDPLAGDPLAEDPLSHAPSASDAKDVSTSESAIDERFDPQKMLPAGGWYRDDLRMAIAYRGTGHSDPVLKSTVEMLAQLPPSDSVRKRLLATRAISACVSCHPSAARKSGSWTGPPLVGNRANFTKFAHGPHLHIAQLADCAHCHTVASSHRNAIGAITLVGDSTGKKVDSEFLPLTRDACAACHTAKAAGDNCTKCHRYHIEF